MGRKRKKWSANHSLQSSEMTSHDDESLEESSESEGDLITTYDHEEAEWTDALNQDEERGRRGSQRLIYGIGDRSEDTPPDENSRTRRRLRVRQDLNVRRSLLNECTRLDPSVFIGLDISDALLSALARLRGMKGSGARQRLVKHTSNLTSEEEWMLLDTIARRAREAPEREARREKKLKNWRDRLVAEGEEALLPAMTRFPNADLRELRQLTLRARRNPDSPSAKGAQRALFKLLKALDEARTGRKRS